MPYIDDSKGRRRELIEHGLTPENPGELNFLLTVIAVEYVMRLGLKYTVINDVMGALHAAAAFIAKQPDGDEKTLETFSTFPVGLSRTDENVDLSGDAVVLMAQYMVKRSASVDIGIAQIEAVGAAVSAAAEFYRRVAAPYEDSKISENGDVYPIFDYQTKSV